APLIRFHLRRIDPHRGEDPPPPQIHREGLVVAGVGEAVVAQPVVEGVRAVRVEDLVLQRSDHPGIQDADRRRGWRDETSTASKPAAAPAPSESPASEAAAPSAEKAAECAVTAVELPCRRRLEEGEDREPGEEAPG